MELRISKRVFFDAVVEGGMLSKQMKNGIAHAVQLGESLAEIECEGRPSNECVEKLRAALTDFFRKIQRWWAECGRRKGRVLAKYGKHFEGDIAVVADDDVSGDGTRDENGATLSQSSAGGRPVIDYKELSARSKRRASRELSRAHHTEKLVQAAAQSARADGQSDLPYVLKKTMASPTRPSKIRRTIKEVAMRPKPECITPDMALAMSVASDLTVHGYNVVRSTARGAAKSNIFPSKHQVREAKQRCCPPAGATTVTETSASVTLQSVLDHTVERLAEAHNVLSSLDSPDQVPSAFQ